MDAASTIRAARRAAHVGPVRSIRVGIRPTERRISERACSAANPADIWGVPRAVHVLVWAVSGDEVSSRAPGEISPVAGAEPLDESRSAAAGAGDVCLAGRDAYRCRVGAGVNALWR